MTNREKLIKATIESAQVAYDKTYKHYYKEYHLCCTNLEKIKTYSRTHSVLECLIRYYEYELMIQSDLYDIYILFEDVCFKPKTYASFTRKFKLCRYKGIKESLIHGLIDKLGNRKKLTDFHYKLIKKYYADKAKYSAEQITDFVNRDLLLKGHAQISSSTVRRVIQTPDFKVVHAIKRYGYEYLTREYLPFLTREKPAFSGEVWEIDGTVIPFASINEGGEYSRLWLFAVMDVHSSKILGYSISHSENTEMIIEALYNASKTHFLLPHEIVYDNSRAYKSSEFLMIKDNSEFYGVDWRQCRPHNPGDKGHIERFFKTFQERFCKMENGYLGGSPTAKNIDSRPSKEELSKIIRKGNLKSRGWIESTIARLIDEYNKAGLNKKISPQVEFDYGLDAERTIGLTEKQLIYIFWKSKTIKLSRGAISFSLVNRYYRYISYDFGFLSKYGNTRILVKYNPKDLSEIFLFDLKKHTHIKSLKLETKIPVARTEHTAADKEIIRRHYNKVKEIVQTIKKGTEQIGIPVPTNLPTRHNGTNLKIKKEYAIYKFSNNGS